MSPKMEITIRNNIVSNLRVVVSMCSRLSGADIDIRYLCLQVLEWAWSL